MTGLKEWLDASEREGWEAESYIKEVVEFIRLRYSENVSRPLEMYLRGETK